MGKYSRDEQLIPLEEAIRKLSGLAAENLGLENRGLLKEGYFADIVVFDPENVQDHATFNDPLKYATGVSDVIINGETVMLNESILGQCRVGLSKAVELLYPE